MVTDRTFITNEKGQNLKERFEVLIKDTRYFDCLVGYFFTSGFHSIYKSLENTEKIRVLIGINTDRTTYELISTSTKPKQPMLQSTSAIQFSHAEAKDNFGKTTEKEIENSEDNQSVEESINKFIQWIKSNKLEIRAYPSQNIHAKLYIMTFVEGDKDLGRVITGSSNFTQAGLVDNLEFNVELKNRSDYEFALEKFNELWKDSVDVSDKYVQTIQNKTWLKQDITPYELYLKFLYEYFKGELSLSDELFHPYLPEGFLKLEYQEQAVLNSKKILDEYGGVFISDVVGLGKTYVASMLAGQLDGRTLVIAPPALLDKTTPGSWPNVLNDFRVPAVCESVGMLESILKRGVDKFANIIIDEAHRFRTETNITYEMIAEICRGKRVILVTATPYNNSPKDILAQIKLFQKARKSTIPNLPDIEWFFNKLDGRFNGLDKQLDYDKYIKIIKENAKEIRQKVLKYLMVRRTRSEINKYFSKDMATQNFKFPEVEKPEPLFYELNEAEDGIFNKTIHLIVKEFTYARYTPMLYYKDPITPLEIESQRNMGKFMKILLVKRLESSFFAFRKSIERFIKSYEMFLREYENGNVYISKKYSNKVFELLESDNDEALQNLIDAGKVEIFSSNNFSEGLKNNLLKDIETLKLIESMWRKIERDPKIIKLLDEIQKNQILKNNKIIVFTESRETADYIKEKIDISYPNITICFTGASSEHIRNNVIENFDARARNPKNDYRILVSTEVLSEGVNLHRSNVVINYDIPWNPTRMMQRVGRINRVDTKFDKIYTFNFFPTKQSNDQIKLREIAELKINSFLTLLGGDSALLTEGEPISSHELFNRLLSKQVITGEDDSEESELKYLHTIKEIRDKNPDLFDIIKNIPKKARSAKKMNDFNDSLLSYFKLGKIQKFFISKGNDRSEELDFLSAAKILESTPENEQEKIPKNYFNLLGKNKEAFSEVTSGEELELEKRRGSDKAVKIIKSIKFTLKNTKQLTDEQEIYLKKVLTQLEEGGLPKQTTKELSKALDKLNEDIENPLKVLSVLHLHIPERLLDRHFGEVTPLGSNKREVILSLYLPREENG